jgi:phosphatidylinositol alpha-1,6-mannosyltransferase
VSYSKKRFLFLTLRIFSATGGIERMCRILGKAIHDISVKQGGSLAVLSMYDDTDLLYSNPYFGDTEFKGYTKNKIKFFLASIRRGFKTDVVVLSHVNLAIIGWLIKLILPRKKIILIAHGIEIWESKSFFQNLYLRSIDKIVAVSNYTKEKIINKTNIAENRISVINNCIDPFLANDDISLYVEEWKKKIGISSGRPVILTLCRVGFKDREKGYVRVIESLKKVKDIHSDFLYIIAGDVEENEKKYLDGIIHEYGLNENILFTGFIEERYLPALFSLSTVFVMPSTKEGFGVAFLEAMFYDKSVIAGNLDGSRDALLQGQLGMLVDPYDINNLAKVISEVLSNPEKHKPDTNVLMANFGYSVYKGNFEKLFNSL